VDLESRTFPEFANLHGQPVKAILPKRTSAIQIDVPSVSYIIDIKRTKSIDFNNFIQKNNIQIHLITVMLVLLCWVYCNNWLILRSFFKLVDLLNGPMEPVQLSVMTTLELTPGLEPAQILCQV
jgi:hypothetical protein